MISSADIDTIVSYVGKAFKFPAGIKSVEMKLVSYHEASDSAFLESTAGNLFGVLGRDCEGTEAPFPPINYSVEVPFENTRPMTYAPEVDLDSATLSEVRRVRPGSWTK